MYDSELSKLLVLIGHYASLHLPSVYANDEKNEKLREDTRLEILKIIEATDKKLQEKQDVIITAAAVLYAKNHLERESNEYIDFDELII